MPPQQLEAAMNVAITSEIESKIHDIVEDIRDLKDQMKASRNQLAYLLYQEADKQRAEAAGKIMVKNWWQFAEADDNHGLLSEHRENIIQWAAKEAGINPKDIGKFHYEHAPTRKINAPIYHGACWLPLRQAEADGMVHPKFWQKGHGRMAQWKIETFDQWQQQTRSEWATQVWTLHCGLWPYANRTAQGNDGNNHKSEPRPQMEASWKHLTLQAQDSEEYIAWLALDRLEGIAKIYIDQQHFAARQFEDEFNTALGAIMTRKTIGNKGKGKTKGGEGVLTPEDFLKAVGLGNEGKGSYFKVSTLTMKTKVPFAFEVRTIAQAEFTTKYTEHLNRIAKRILQPDMIL